MNKKIVEKDWKKWLLIWWCYTGIISEEEQKMTFSEIIKKETKSLIDLIFILKINNLKWKQKI